MLDAGFIFSGIISTADLHWIGMMTELYLL